MNIKKLITEKLLRYPDRMFTVVLNNDIINHDGSFERPKIVRARYKQDRYSKEVILGYYVKKADETRLEDIEAVKMQLEDKILDTKIGEVDLAEYIVDKEKIEIKVFPEFNVISIITPAYRLAKEVSLKEQKDLMNGVTIAGKKLEVGAIVQLRSWFTKYSIESYHDVIKYILIRRLKECRELKFYFLLGSYVPVVIYGDSSNFLFNPFVSLPEMKKPFQDSLMYLMSRQTIKEYEGLTINFATPLEICRGFNLNKFVKFNYEFFIEVLGGWFSSSMPTPDVAIYFYTGNADEDDVPAVMTEEQYKQADWAKDSYLKVTTLEYACRSYFRTLEVPERQVRDFCELMGKRVLLDAQRR